MEPQRSGGKPGAFSDAKNKFLDDLIFQRKQVMNLQERIRRGTLSEDDPIYKRDKGILDKLEKRYTEMMLKDRAADFREKQKAKEASKNALPEVTKSDTPSTRTFTKSTMNKAINRWADMLDDNMKPEIRVSIAKFFKYSDLVDAAKANLKEHDRQGSLTPAVHAHREAIDKELERRVTRDFGEDLWKRIERNAF